MNYKKMTIGCAFVVIIVVAFYFSWRGFKSLDSTSEYRAQIPALQTIQAKTEQDMKSLLALDLASQARSINIEDNPNQMTAALLAVQSLKMSPTIDAMQVLQANRSPRMLSHIEYDDSVTSVALSPDGRFVVTGSTDHTARVREIVSRKEIARTTHNALVQSVAFSQNGEYVASGDAEKVIRVWSASTGQEVVSMSHYAPVSLLAFSPDGKYLASSSLDSAVVIRDATTGMEIAHPIHDGFVTVIAFSPDSKRIVIGSLDNTVRTWDITTGREIARVTHFKPVTAIAFSPDGKYVVSGSANGIVYIWDSSTGEKIVPGFSYGPGEEMCLASVTSVAFSPDGKYVAVGCKDMSPTTELSDNPYHEEVTIRVWKASDEKKGEYTFMSEIIFTNTVNSVAFSPNGKYLLAGSDDHIARIWEITTGREVSRMTHDDAITSVAFSPDGEQVISDSSDHAVRVWETLPWQENIHGSNSGVITTIAFSTP